MIPREKLAAILAACETRDATGAEARRAYVAARDAQEGPADALRLAADASYEASERERCAAEQLRALLDSNTVRDLVTWYGSWRPRLFADEQPEDHAEVLWWDAPEWVSVTFAHGCWYGYRYEYTALPRHVWLPMPPKPEPAL